MPRRCRLGRRAERRARRRSRSIVRDRRDIRALQRVCLETATLLRTMVIQGRAVGPLPHRTVEEG